MNIIGVQLIIFGFSFLMVYNLFLHYKKGDIGINGFFVWFVLWVGLFLVAFFPKVIEPLVKNMFFVRVFDFATVIAFIVITYVEFENHIRINKLQQELEKLVRKMAIERIDRKKI